MNRRVWISTAVVMVLFYGSVVFYAWNTSPRAPQDSLPDTGPGVTEVDLDEQKAQVEQQMRALGERFADPRLTMQVMTRRLAKNDTDVEALRLRGQAHFLFSEWLSAAADFDRLLPLTSGAEKSWFALEAAYSYHIAGKVNDAKDRYDLAFTLGKQHRCITGEYYYRRGQFRAAAYGMEFALEDFENAGQSLDLRRAYMAYENLSHMAYGKGDVERGDAYGRLADRKRAEYDKTKKR